MSRRLLSGSAWSLAAVCVGTLALLALGKLLTNSLPAAGVGQVAVILLVGELLGLAGGRGLPTALPKLMGSTASGLHRTLLALLLGGQARVTLYLALACVGGLLTRPWWPDSLQEVFPAHPWVVVVLPVLIAMVVFRDFLLAATAGCQAYRRRALALMTQATVQVLQFAVLYVLRVEDPMLFVIAHLAAGMAGIAVLTGGLLRLPATEEKAGAPALHFRAWKTFRRAPQYTVAERRAARKAIYFAAPLYVNNLMNFVFQRVDTLVIIAWLDLGTAAILEMTKRLPTLVSRFLGAALVPYLPALTRHLREDDHASAGALIRQTATLAAFVGYSVTLLMIALAQPLLAALFTRDYVAGAPVLGLLLLATCLAVQGGIMGQALIALERPKTVMYINLGLGALSLALNCLLVPRLGLMGVGWSALVAAAFSLVMQQRAVMRSPLPLPFLGMAKIHVIFLIALGGTTLFAGALLPQLLIAGGFVVLCWWTRTISVGMVLHGGRP